MYNRPGSAQLPNPFKNTPYIAKLTELIEVRISAGDVRVELVVIANGEYRSVHLPQLVDVLLRYIPKSDISTTCCLLAAFAHLYLMMV